MFPIMLSVGLSQGVAPLIGFYYGAKQRKRLQAAMRISILYGMALGESWRLNHIQGRKK